MVETHVIRLTGRGSLAAPLLPQWHACWRSDLGCFSMCQTIAARRERSSSPADGRASRRRASSKTIEKAQILVE